MNPFKRDEPCFLVDPFEHAGRYRGVHGGTMMCWEVKDTMVEPFGDITAAVCSELENYRFPRSMVVMFDLFLRGTSSTSVEVFVMLAGATEQHRKKAVKRLRKSSLAKKYPGLKMDHWNWPPDVPQVVMMASDDDTLQWTTVHRSQGYDIRFSGKSPEGSSLEKLGDTSYHIVATDRGNAGFRREATAISTSVPKDTRRQKMGVLGHFVVVGGDRYLLVPAHIFLSDEPEEDDEFLDTDDTGSDSISESSSDIESSFDVMLRAGSATPPDLDSQPASDSATEDNPSDRTFVLESSTRRMGKQLNLPPPSLASVVPCAKVLSIELDYALVPFPPTGRHDFQSNLRCLVEETTALFPGQRNANGTLSGAIEHSISVTTPSQGLMRGTISTRPVMMRLPHSKTFSMLYPLELPSPVKEGDCGSVVFDQHSRVYGFIAAGSTSGNVAYIVPAAKILNDIRSKTSRMPDDVLVGPYSLGAWYPAPTEAQVCVTHETASWKPDGAGNRQQTLEDNTTKSLSQSTRVAMATDSLRSSVAETNHPVAYNASGESKLTRLSTYTSLSTEPIRKALADLAFRGRPDPPINDSTHKRLSSNFDKEPRWLRPKTNTERRLRFQALESSVSRSTTATGQEQRAQQGSQHSGGRDDS